MVSSAAVLQRDPVVERVLHWFTGTVMYALYASFVLAGTVSAVVSSVAEYEVVTEFFKKHPAVGVASFAAMVVFVLEVSKMFLVFFNRQYADSDDPKYHAVKGLFNAVRYALVVMSGASMMLWTLYNLSNPEYGAKVSQAMVILSRDHDSQVTQIRESYKARAAEQFALDQADVEYWRARMSFEMNNVVGKTWEGPQFKSNKERFDLTREKQEKAQARLAADELGAETAADARLRLEEDSVRVQLKTATASGNELLSAALAVLNGGADYPRWEYTAGVIVVSLLLTLALESTIWAVFSVLAITYGDAFTASLNVEPAARQYSAAGRMKSKMQAEDERGFYARVLREKESVERAVRVPQQS